MQGEFDALLAVKWCWDNGIKIYPVVSGKDSPSFRAATMRGTDKVKIVIQNGTKKREGTETYNQDKKLYEKIEELYIHLYEKRHRA
tara:strand:- start:1703 stop:1960 length:258 start_codon:yes stop_codon:yes gene_type:complete